MTYDDFSQDYDRFVNWKARLGAEMPFIEAQLQKTSGMTPGDRPRVLDSACGTGMHAVALAQQGYRAAGADLSAGMIARARANADAAGVRIRFETAGFGGLVPVFIEDDLFPFDGLLCLGNSLPHLLDRKDLAAALDDFAACLRSGGLLLIQNRNFDAVLRDRQRWMEPQSHQQGDADWVFLRFYDFEPDGLIRFNIITLKREGTAGWQQSVTSTHLYPLRQAELSAVLGAAGFRDITCYGDMSGTPFDPERSGNLVVTAIG